MAWRTLFVLGLVSVSAVACTTTVSVNGNLNDGGPDGSGATGSGGKSGSGGSSQGGGGSSSGGASQGGGGASSGGTTSTGGADSGPAVCDPSSTTEVCTKCLFTYCCQEYNDCVDDRCHGTADAGDNGELICMIDCLQHGFAGDGGFTSRDQCATRCQGSNPFLATTTRDLIACMAAPLGDGSPDQRCGQDCFHGQAQ